MKVALKKQPELVLRNGKASAVIIDIEEYKKILEMLEDASDLRLLEQVRKKRPKFRKLEDFLKEKFPHV